MHFSPYCVSCADYSLSYECILIKFCIVVHSGTDNFMIFFLFYTWVATLCVNSRLVTHML